MEKLKMKSVDGVAKNIEAIGRLFPNAITEVRRNGKVEQAIDFDVLRQELSNTIVEGREERYQFTWPDKKKAMLAANAPISATLRPVKEESVNFDTTENLYIEGDNLEVLKLLQETYLGKVKMIYIDPPYNTGNDFVYEDDFAQDKAEYMANSGQYDEQGNRLEKNLDSNGRFHTDWLNMMYPRLKLAKSLLRDDGAIFISIDDNELEKLKMCCNSIYGANNFIAQIVIVTGANQSGDGVLIQKNVEYCLIYGKNANKTRIIRVDETENSYRNLNDAPTPLETRDEMGYTIYYNPETKDMRPIKDYDKTKIYTNNAEKVYTDDRALIRQGYVPVRPGMRNKKLHRWRWGFDTFLEREKEVCIFKIKEGYVPKFLQKGYNAPKNIQHFTGGSIDLKKIFGEQIPFSYPKGISFIQYICNISLQEKDIVVDFFSGSATTAHAVMQLNAEDKGKRKFIMVQIPELTDKKSEAYKAGYKTICEIGKERIRRAAKKIAEEHPEATFDGGFRVLKLDSSNMQDVYYNPAEVTQQSLAGMVDNIKEDRAPEDLLFQVMLDLGVELSSKISVMEIGGKKVFDVAENYLLACFDSAVDSAVVTAMAKKTPYYAVFRDASFADDSTAANFEQIFKTYSPDTKTKVL